MKSLRDTITVFQFEWVRPPGAMLQRFGGFNTREVLGNDILQSPKNAFTASLQAHVLFDALEIWLTLVKVTCLCRRRLRLPGTELAPGRPDWGHCAQ